MKKKSIIEIWLNDWPGNLYFGIAHTFFSYLQIETFFFKYPLMKNRHLMMHMALQKLFQKI